MAEELDDLVEDVGELLEELGVNDWVVTDPNATGDPTTGIVVQSPIAYSNVVGSVPLDWRTVYGPAATDKVGVSVVYFPAYTSQGVSVGFEPSVGWLVSRAGRSWRVVAVETMAPSSRTAAWRCDVTEV